MEKDITKGFKDEEEKDSQQSKEIKLEIYVYEGFLENFKGYRESMQEKILGMKIIPELTRVELSNNLPKQAQKSVMSGRQASKLIDQNFKKEIEIYKKAQQVKIIKPEIVELSKPLSSFKNANKIYAQQFFIEQNQNYPVIQWEKEEYKLNMNYYNKLFI